MTATLTFHPLGNADCTRIDFANGKKMLVDYADMRNDDDLFDKRIDLPAELKADLRAAKQDYYDVVCFTHLDDDHCCGAGDFFWLQHALKYQGDGRTKINELWVPAAAILEDGCEDSARIVRQEARHRLKQGSGIRVFSRPAKLKEWLEDNGLTLESRAHLITDAGQYVPGFTKFGSERAEFFIHSLSSLMARGFVAWLADVECPGVRITALKRAEAYEAVLLDVETERPQLLAYPIRACEPVAVLFPLTGGQPRILSMREDFPDTPHQNWTPQGAPCSLCVDDRPWSEARLSYTSADLLRRIHLWLAEAARGELHDAAQPPEPLFFKNPLSFVIPAAALTSGSKPAELIGCIHPDNPGLVYTRLATAGGSDGEIGRFVVLPFQAAPQSMTRLRHAPETLAALAQECEAGDIDLLASIRASVADWAGHKDDNLRRLSARLAVVVAFPVKGPGDGVHHDLRGFVTYDTAGEVGSALGVIAPNETNTGGKGGYFNLIGAKPTSKGEGVRIEPIEVHFAFDRAIGAAVAGHAAPDARRAVLVGAGAIGSQVAITLAREGAFTWSVIDQDILLPHNFARHALFPWDTGTPKATALGRQLSALTGDSIYVARADAADLPPNLKAEIDARLTEADIIIDASASVAVSRHLSDLATAKARRFSVFFNPSGAAVVLLAEPADRKVTLRDLEAQYHRLHLSEPTLADHLKVDVPGLRYSGSCRSATNRIPASRAALLSAIAARGISTAIKEEQATIRVWTVSEEGEVALTKRDGAAVTRHDIGDWTIAYDDEVRQALLRYRAEALPAETGGVLIGITDTSRRSIHVAHVMRAPEDSKGSVTAFERGVAGLSDAVEQAAKASMHQLRYVGEWHSHPRGSSPMPSRTDLGQIAWLGTELQNEGLPALMAIAADGGAFAFVFADMAGPAEGKRAKA